MEFLINNLPTFLILAILFLFLYIMGGDDIVFFKKKKNQFDPKASEKLLGALNKFARLRGFEVLGKTTLEFEGKEYTFDGILIGFYGTIAFNMVDRSGDIYGDNGAEQWVQIFDGRRQQFESPVVALNGSIKFFKDIYRTEKVKCGLVDTLTVFTDKNVNIGVARSLPVYHVDNLVNKLDSSKYLADNGANVQAMKEALAKYTK